MSVVMPLVSSARTTAYRPDIDGLRTLAILPVVLFHAGVPFCPGGFAGVDVFFVISGFLIGSHVYLEMTARRFSLATFYLRRAKRILPALILVVGTLYIPAAILLSGAELRELALESLTTLTSTSNIYFAAAKSNYFASAAGLSPLLMTWSLGVEEQFYLGFPFLLSIVLQFLRRRLLWAFVLLSVASFLLASCLSIRFPTPAFYLLPTRAWEIGVGTIAGIFTADRRPAPLIMAHRGAADALGVLALGTLLLTFLFARAESGFPGSPALAPCLATIALLCAPTSQFNRRVLSSMPFVWIGRVSYSWYLWHWPLMSLVRITLAGTLPLHIALAIAAISLGLAALTYRFVEQPFRSPARGAAGPRLARYPLALALCGVPALMLCAADGWPARYPAAQRIDAVLRQSGPDVCLLSYRETAPRQASPCFTADTSRPALAIMGDSHAAALAPFLRTQARAHAWFVDDFTKTSCPQLGVITRSIPNRSTHAAECEAFNRRAVQAVMSAPEIHTIILAGFWSAPFGDQDSGERFLHAEDDPASVTLAQSWRNLQRGLHDVVQELQAHGKRVLIVIDAPRFDIDPVLSARTSAIPPRRALNLLLGGSDLVTGEHRPIATVNQADHRSAELVRRVAQDTGAVLIDPRVNLCAASLCNYERDGTPLYVDQQHLSLAGAQDALRGAPVF